MKKFIEVLLVVVAIFLATSGEIAGSIFVGMFAVLCIIVTAKLYKTPQEYLAEANDELYSGVSVEYCFCSEMKEKFTADLHYYNKSLEYNKVLEALAEYVSEHTGIPTAIDRLHIISMKPTSNI